MQICAKTTELTILIGDWDEITIDLVSELVVDVVGPSRNVCAIATNSLDRLNDLLISTQPDMLFLFLNNVMSFRPNIKSRERILTVINVIRKARLRCNIPIVAYSGFPGYGDEARAAGADFYFDTPFRLVDFTQALSTCFDKYKL